MAEGLERLREVEQQAQRLENELEIARQVQQNLFPKELPQPEAWQFAALCRPARAVGGDYYDLFDIDSARIAFALGDVSGKGLGPSLLMSSVHTLIRSASPEELEHLPRLISRLNDHLERSTSPEMFVTLFVGVLDTKTGSLRYVNGGHNPPMLLPGGGAGPVRLERGGIVVGILPKTPYREGQVHLDPGSLLVLYSDGVTEAVNENGDMFEEERLLEVLSRVRGEPASLILSSVLESVDSFVGNNEQADDISLIVMKRQS
jgi:sigma-B regulation protein RsbU (phosphoserine phosphatase)